MPAAPRRRPSRARRAWTWGRYLLGVALGLLALWAVSGQRGELAGAASELAHLKLGWLALAVGSEVVSFVAFSRMQGQLLTAGDTRMHWGRLLSLTFAAGAIASSIPAGPAVASVYAYRQYRRVGADEALAGWTLLATLVCSALGITLLTAAGVLIAERQGAALDLVGVSLGLLAAALLAAVLLWRRRVLISVVRGLTRAAERLARVNRDRSEALLSRITLHLQRVDLSWGEFLPALAWAVVNWALDCGCLVCGYLAVGASVPVRGILLAYGAAQLAANLPITPGGLGVVEGSLTVALVAYGGAQVSTVAAVILYRIISFWGYLPAGWLVWAGLALHDRRQDRHSVAAPAPQDEGVAA